jgi:chitinase
MLTFLPGQTEKVVSVIVNGDTEIEPDEDFTLMLSNAAHAVITDEHGTGTIENDVVVTDVIAIHGFETIADPCER